jgi:hypothetical protein
VVVGVRAGEDGSMADTVTVWMVHLGGPDPSDVEGRLSLDADALVFEHGAKPAELRFPYAAIAKVRRVMGSPVIIVEWDENAQRRSTAFYFVQPPPLRPPSPDEVATRSDRPPGLLAQRRATSKRRHMRANIGYLTVTAKRSKPLVREWTSELRVRVRDARA